MRESIFAKTTCEHLLLYGLRPIRSIHELLKIIDQVYRKKEIPYSGLCSVIISCSMDRLINLTEFIALKAYLEQNKPRSAKKYHFYYFEPYSRPPRLQWLKKHIELTKFESYDSDNQSNE